MGDFTTERLFQKFLELEGLSNSNFTIKLCPPTFTTGKVTNFQVDNILLVGRAAGLTERIVGQGSIAAIISGIEAARAVIKGKDYHTSVKSLQDTVEDFSAIRSTINKFDNDDFDKVIGLLNTPGIKHLVYNSGINFTQMAGWILRKLGKSE